MLMYSVLGFLVVMMVLRPTFSVSVGLLGLALVYFASVDLISEDLVACSVMLMIIVPASPVV